VIQAEVTYEPEDYVRALRFMSRRPSQVFNLFMLVGAIVLALMAGKMIPINTRVL